MDFQIGDLVRFQDRYGENQFGKILSFSGDPVVYRVLRCYDGKQKIENDVPDMKMMEVLYREPK